MKQAILLIGLSVLALVGCTQEETIEESCNYDYFMDMAEALGYDRGRLSTIAKPIIMFNDSGFYEQRMVMIINYSIERDEDCYVDKITISDVNFTFTETIEFMATDIEYT